jgi:hypothetical protein
MMSSRLRVTGALSPAVIQTGGLLSSMPGTPHLSGWVVRLVAPAADREYRVGAIACLKGDFPKISCIIAFTRAVTPRLLPEPYHLLFWDMSSCASATLPTRPAIVAVWSDLDRVRTGSICRQFDIGPKPSRMHRSGVIANVAVWVCVM